MSAITLCRISFACSCFCTVNCRVHDKKWHYTLNSKQLKSNRTAVRSCITNLKWLLVAYTKPSHTQLQWNYISTLLTKLIPDYLQFEFAFVLMVRVKTIFSKRQSDQCSYSETEKKIQVWREWNKNPYS